MGCLNVHKALGWSQITKSNMGALEPNDLNRTDALIWHDIVCPPERMLMGENGKWATRTCTRHPGGHNLAKLIRAPLNETTRPECAWSADLTRCDTARPTE